MTESISDIAFAPAVKRILDLKGLRKGCAMMEAKGGWRNTVTDDLDGSCWRRDDQAGG